MSVFFASENSVSLLAMAVIPGGREGEGEGVKRGGVRVCEERGCEEREGERGEVVMCIGNRSCGKAEHIMCALHLGTHSGFAMYNKTPKIYIVKCGVSITIIISHNTCTEHTRLGCCTYSAVQ